MHCIETTDFIMGKCIYCLIITQFNKIDLLMKMGLVKSDIQYTFKGPVWDISKGLMDIKWNLKKIHRHISIHTYLCF